MKDGFYMLFIRVVGTKCSNKKYSSLRYNQKSFKFQIYQQQSNKFHRGS